MYVNVRVTCKNKEELSAEWVDIDCFEILSCCELHVLKVRFSCFSRNLLPFLKKQKLGIKEKSFNFLRGVILEFDKLSEVAADVSYDSSLFVAGLELG